MAERAWSGHTPGARALRAALVPAAVAYGAAAALRNRLYDVGLLGARRVPAHVVSVGNISVGGTGKTPAALWLAERLAARGARVGIVARGYGKRRPGVVVVGEGGTPLVGAEEGGDEAVLLARRFPGPVVTGEERFAAAALACARYALDTVVLDDGFQHRALARDADLVLLGEADVEQWPLPAGPLREWSTSLRRARALLAIDTLPGRWPAGLPLFRGRLRPTAAIRVEGAGQGSAQQGPVEQGSWIAEPLESLVGGEVIAVAGMARPGRLAAALRALGARVRRELHFPDHHRYGRADVAQLAAAAREGVLVTTEKDLVKLGGLPGLETLRALRVALEVEDGERLLELLARPPSVDSPAV